VAAPCVPLLSPHSRRRARGSRTGLRGGGAALSACPGQDEFGCATIDVPLDRTGSVPGTVPLHYAIQRRGPKKVLIALSGGPGQSGRLVGLVVRDLG
jgi:hypothetical protein